MRDKHSKTGDPAVGSTRLVGRSTEQQIVDEVNARRDEAFRLLEKAADIFSATGCSLGADTVGMCLHQLREDGCDEY